MIKFTWDENKNKQNVKKHGVSFEEAVSVFFDEHALEFYDDAILGEDRFLMLGLSEKAKILLVCHCLRDDGATIRIISARLATVNETEEYQR